MKVRLVTFNTLRVFYWPNVHFNSLLMFLILPAVKYIHHLDLFYLCKECWDEWRKNLLLWFFSDLAALDKKVDKVRHFLLLHAWMESERETSGRSKRATKSRRTAKFRLPYFPLYPIDIPGRFIDLNDWLNKKVILSTKNYVYLVADMLKRNNILIYFLLIFLLIYLHIIYTVSRGVMLTTSLRAWFWTKH